ncbi:hypothetical protein C8R46DRAFT_1025872 [Mycena filopes]|nr:hypothetical protein C8R46DRAFT_1025872 [Mycena filopes]
MSLPSYHPNLCSNCGIPSTQNALRSCACRKAQYCSKRCMKRHQQTHESECGLNKIQSLLLSYPWPSELSTGNNALNIEKCMPTWCHYYQQPLESAAVQGLQLLLNPEFARDHIIRLKISLHPDHTKLHASQYFQILEVGVIPTMIALQHGGPWTDMAQEIIIKHTGEDTIGRIAIEHPFGIHLLHFHAPTTYHTPILENWVEVLLDDITHYRQISKTACSCYRTQLDCDTGQRILSFFSKAPPSAQSLRIRFCPVPPTLALIMSTPRTRQQARQELNKARLELPSEVKELIFENLPQGALLRVSKLSSNFRAIAVPLLHHHICVDYSKLDNLYASWVNSDLNGKHFSSKVKSFTLRDDAQLMLSHNDRTHENSVDLLARVIERIPNVQELHFFVGVDAPSILRTYMGVLHQSFPQLHNFTWTPQNHNDDSLGTFLANHTALRVVNIRYPFGLRVGLDVTSVTVLDLPWLWNFQGPFSYFVALGDTRAQLTHLRLHLTQEDIVDVLGFREALSCACTLQSLDVVIEHGPEPTPPALDVLDHIASSLLSLTSLKITQKEQYKRSHFNQNDFIHQLEAMPTLISLTLDAQWKVSGCSHFTIVDSLGRVWDDEIGHSSDDESYWARSDADIFLEAVTLSNSHLTTLQINCSKWEFIHKLTVAKTGKSESVIKLKHRIIEKRVEVMPGEFPPLW